MSVLNPEMLAQRADEINRCLKQHGLILGTTQNMIDDTPEGTFVVSKPSTSRTRIVGGMDGQCLQSWIGKCLLEGSPSPEKLARRLSDQFDAAPATRRSIPRISSKERG